MTSWVRAFAPATVANLGPGFDILGLALEGPGDRVSARRCSTSGVHIVAVDGDNQALSTDANRNTAGIAALETLRLAKSDIGVELHIEKGLPIGSGLGSSAASAAAAATAINLLLGRPFRKHELIAPCLAAEAAVSGRHADNIAPALLGGLIMVRSLDPIEILRLPIPSGLTIGVVTPDCVIETKAARDALPDPLPLPTAIENSANLAALISACHVGDISLLARCMHDQIATPTRRTLIPGFDEVIAAALNAGAIGAGISGSGPSLFTLCRSEMSCADAVASMQAAFQRAGLQSTTTVSPADCPGSRHVS